MDYALLVGINKYPGAPLSGCVNDVLDMGNLLVEQYGFLRQNVRLLVDERATTQAIRERIEWLVSELKSGDRLLFHFSGHGTQVATRNKDQEIDGLDEVICPVDFDWSDERMIRDKEFSRIFSNIPDDVVFVWISDSCHSGDLNRDMIFGADPMNHQLGVRHYPKPADVEWREKAAVEMGLVAQMVLDQNVTLLSGCRSDQTSADALINGRPNGAFTFCLIEALKEKGMLTLLPDLLYDVHVKLTSRRYSQEPELACPPARLKLAFLA